jgi:transcription elongation factor S-II
MPLDAKSVEQRGRDLTKAAESGMSDSAAVLRILSELRGGVAASDSLLRSTKIGMIVNKLKKHPNPQVIKQADELVLKWRNDMRRLGRANVPVGGGTASGASTPRPGGNVSSPAAAAVVSPKQKRPDVPKEKRNSKTDGVNWKVTGNETRDNCVKLMYDGLAFMSEDRKFLPPISYRYTGDLETLQDLR